jgi:hypothetical protein
MTENRWEPQGAIASEQASANGEGDVRRNVITDTTPSDGFKIISGPSSATDAVQWALYCPDYEFIPGAALMAVYQDEALGEAMLACAEYVASNGMPIVLMHLNSAPHSMEDVAAAWANVVTYLVAYHFLDDDAAFGLLADGSIELIFAAYTKYHAVPSLMRMCPTAQGYEELLEAGERVLVVNEESTAEISRAALMFGASAFKGDISRSRETAGQMPPEAWGLARSPA